MIAPGDPAPDFSLPRLDGTILGWLGSSGRQLGQFNWIHSLDCSQMADGVLYVADMNNWRVQKLLFGR